MPAMRIEADENGFPEVSFTKGQKDLLAAAIPCGITSFQLRSNPTSTVVQVTVEKQGNEHLVVQAEWWGTGRFRCAWIERFNGPMLASRIKVSDLVTVVDTLTEFAAPPKKAKAKKSA